MAACVWSGFFGLFHLSLSDTHTVGIPRITGSPHHEIPSRQPISVEVREIPDTIVAGNRKRKKATHSREFLPKTKPIKITFFVFKCHHQKATIQSHLMPLPMLSLSSVTSWAISFHLEDVMAPSRHCPVIKTNTSDEKTLTAVPLGNLSMVTEIHYKKHQQQLVKVQENQTTPPQYLQTA